MWDGLRALRVVNCFINWKTWEFFKKRFTSVDNKGRCKFLAIAANGLSEDFRRPLPTFELQWLNMKNNRFNWAISAFTKLYVCCFDCDVLYWYSPWKSILVCLFHAREANWEVLLKIYHPCCFKISFDWVSSQSERMYFVWK